MYQSVCNVSRVHLVVIMLERDIIQQNVNGVSRRNGKYEGIYTRIKEGI